jgi:hypothetical protein
VIMIIKASEVMVAKTAAEYHLPER